MSNYQITIDQSDQLHDTSRAIIWDLGNGEVVWRGKEHFSIEEAFKEASDWFVHEEKIERAMIHG